MNLYRYTLHLLIFLLYLSNSFAQTKEKAHRTFGIECMNCHTTNSWTDLQKNISFDHKVTGYYLVGEHKNAKCEGCHNKISFDQLKTTCFSCHKDPHKGELGDQCQSCHSPSGWRAPSQEIQRHALTRFPLTGPHAIVDCKSCHANQESKEYVNTPTECFSCHTQQFTSANKPDHVGNHFDRNCLKCHILSAGGWTGSFVHPYVEFMFSSGHKTLDCAQCHTGTIGYTNTPTACYGCHQTDYANVKSPNHLAGNFNHDCTQCHNADKWKPATFDHTSTKFPLVGRHTTVDCQQCHGSGYAGTSTACWSCHQSDYTSVKFPSHAVGNFDHACLTCHSMDGWKPAKFSHDQTKFPLTGAHVTTECQKCHINGNLANMSLECQGCHTQNYQNTTEPNHQLVGFSMQCQSCHSTQAWQPIIAMPASIDHDKTRFQLVGNHKTVLCEKCHMNFTFKGTSTDCFSCHTNDFNNVQKPNHVASSFPHACLNCHNMNGWKPATFDHNTTHFPLTGAHTSVLCEKCHANGKYSGLATDCYSCHQNDYANVTAPNHLKAQFAHDCTTCHNTVTWKPSTFDHAATKFPLTGAHIMRVCEDCHINGDYNLTYTECYQCHKNDFNQVQSPNHLSNLFNHDCTLCHNTTVWKPSAFDHATTQFPLTGKHVSTDCQKCHTNGNYTIKYTDCYQCHATDFTTPKQPDHVAGQISHDCTKCHNTTAWKPAQFGHAATKFPLTGAHITTACEKCHINGNYNITYTDCYTCHQSDFTSTKQPDHVAGLFDHDCTKCHSTDKWKPAQFDHATTKFPLTGAHITTACEKCHTNGNYNITYKDCYTCHQSDFASSNQPNHVAGLFDHDCTKCHTTTTWKPAQFDHATTKFALTGAHSTTACEKCHMNGDYNITYSDCYQCHQDKYTNVSNPNHVQGLFDHNCTKCHNTIAWKPGFDHSKTNFQLTGAHGYTPCEQCHVNGNYVTLKYTDCYQCHQTDYTKTTQPNHVAGKIDHDCTKCHNTAAWKPASFDHSSTKFALTGAHASTACEKCHVNGDYNIVYTDCYTCHQDKYIAANPNHVTGKFNHDCTKCHTTDAWKPAAFDHSQTNFPLSGAHTSAACEKCHVNGDYNITYTGCYGCHQSNYTSVTKPNHVNGKFDHDCTKCHNTIAWKPGFNHASTNFPLTGAHTSTACEKCHVNGDFNITYTDCYQCHQNDFAAVLNPSHSLGQFPHDCLKCHTTNVWKPSTFNHASTNFPLTGAHTATGCEKCHMNGDYNITYTDCFSCHQNDFAQVTAPNHTSGQFPHDCTKCHTTSAWKPSTFNHASTNFPLTGAHIPALCEKCHENGNYNLTYNDCFQCHESNFNQVSNPGHTTGKFPHDCTMCHTTTAWTPSTFNHGATNFPLAGAHITTPCQNCHVNGNYNLTYTDCFQCHQSDFNGAQNPNHVSNNFPHNCTTCHSTIAWQPSTFNHNNTNFPLAGRHTNVQCTQCHVNGNYQLTYTECYQCHQTDYTGAQNPSHASNQFPHDCTKCHNQNAWQPSTFNHNSTAFPLVGAHGSQPCIQCHVNGNYNIIYTNCWQCHQSNFNSAQNPNHVSNQFPHDCLQCHNQNAWQPSTFNHNTTNFPLIGAHASQPCINCHVNGNYNITYTNCWQCHQTNYTGANNPPHASNQFSHDCTTCHNQTAWQPSTFNHNNTAFPLVGAHLSTPCINCHVSGNYSITYTNCWQCHQTDFNSATSPNHVSNQFPHTCLTCHNQNAWQPSTFNHNSTAFPLVGAHVSQPCINCHVNGNYNLTYTNCYQCHQSDYNGATNPNHVSNQFSQNCTTCHSQNAWQPSTFNHNNTNFPLVGAHTSLQCSQCHTNGNYQLVYSNCYQCHQSNYSGATSPANHTAMNLDHNCTVCHNQTAWNPATPFRTGHSVNYPTAFPIYSGSRHSGKWNNCNQCHTTNNINAFCCTSACHTNQSSLASDHSHVSGYSYTCTSCAVCHPDGRAP